VPKVVHWLYNGIETLLNNLTNRTPTRVTFCCASTNGKAL